MNILIALLLKKKRVRKSKNEKKYYFVEKIILCATIQLKTRRAPSPFRLSAYAGFPTLPLAHNQVASCAPPQFILWMLSGDRFCYLLLISKGKCVVLLHWDSIPELDLPFPVMVADSTLVLSSCNSSSTRNLKPAANWSDSKIVS